MAYDNSNSGVLFINKKRNGNAKAPNLKGNGRITIDGVEYELDLAAWTRESEKTGGKYVSLRIKPAAPSVENRFVMVTVEFPATETAAGGIATHARDETSQAVCRLCARQ